MTLKEYLFYNSMTVTDFAKLLHMHPTYLNAVIRRKYPLTKRLALTIETYTQGLVKADSILASHTIADFKE